MSVRNPRLDVLLALAAHWRSQGEYWSGTPADSRSQGCADDLLTVLGLPMDGHLLADKDAGLLLKNHGVSPNVAPKDISTALGPLLNWHEKLSKELANELASPPHRKVEVILSEKLTHAFEIGFEEGRKAGAKAQEVRYTAPQK